MILALLWTALSAMYGIGVGVLICNGCYNVMGQNVATG